MTLKTFGAMGTDLAERVNFDRLRTERLGKAKETLRESELGAVLCFDMNNIRYLTATAIGTWAMDKLVRFSLLAQDDDPILWDFGSAARHHQLYCPWLGEERSRYGISTLRGATPPEAGRAEDVAQKIKIELEERGLQNEPLGVDIAEPAVIFALQAAGLNVVDGQQLMLNTRKVKTEDEISLLNMACSMVDATYDELYRALRPGVRENEAVAMANKTLYEMGSEHVEGINAISGERCNPHPHNFTDRILRPGDPAYFDIMHSYMGYRTCYYRTLAIGSASPAQRDAYKRAREILDQSIDMIKPGVTTADVASLWPRAQEFGFPARRRPLRCSTGTGWGSPSGRSRSSAGTSRWMPRRPLRKE